MSALTCYATLFGCESVLVFAVIVCVLWLVCVCITSLPLIRCVLSLLPPPPQRAVKLARLAVLETAIAEKEAVQAKINANAEKWANRVCACLFCDSCVCLSMCECMACVCLSCVYGCV